MLLKGIVPVSSRGIRLGIGRDDTIVPDTTEYRPILDAGIVLSLICLFLYMCEFKDSVATTMKRLNTVFHCLVFAGKRWS